MGSGAELPFWGSLRSLVPWDGTVTTPGLTVRSPVECAERLSETGIPNEAARLVLLAAAPWSAANHRLFPATTRAHAVAVLHAGYALARVYGLT